ncbi:MAG TPA: SGNH/GDSL hydrolase family protein [Ktedonobacteraceae bacterium]|nr:SGNH/GDSL hydrolase family protein [Ktedonobacteraceae bacterium]
MSRTTHKEFRQRQGNRWLLWIVIGILVLFCLFLLYPNQPSPHAPLARVHSITIKIMPLGDSITYGAGSSTGGGYRLPLWNGLKERGFSIDFVGSVQTGPPGFDRENEGHPGWEINQIAVKVVNWLITYRPNIILLHIGTNDIFKNDNPAQAPARLSRLLNLITTTLPGATVIVAQIIPLSRSARLNAEVVAYNATIPRIVQIDVARGKHVQYVDMYHAVPPTMLTDQIHPNDVGYFLMANVWLRALLPLLARSTTYVDL